jgi:hypothetical protein
LGQTIGRSTRRWRGSRSGGSSWIEAIPVKVAFIVAVVPTMTGVSSLTAIRIRTNWGVSGIRLIDSTWPTGTPEKVTTLLLAKPSTAWLNNMS